MGKLCFLTGNNEAAHDPAALDLNLIQLFVTIVEAGTLSEAALRQGVTRSHVSRNLQKLERAFGAQLIRRHPAAGTDAHEGSVLYDHGARMAREVESARHALQKLGAEPTGHVRLSLPTGLGELDMLRPLLVRFALEHPSLSLRVLFSNRVSDLISSEIDVALRPSRCRARLCGARTRPHQVAPVRRARVPGAHGHAGHPRDLGRFDFLGPPGPARRPRCACAQGPTARSQAGATLMGVNVNNVYAIAFGLGTAFVGIAAGLLAPQYPVFPTVGTYFVLTAFVIVVLAAWAACTARWPGR
ncbi:CysJI operon transcriptional activator [Achromobacter xylosoxidans]|nr:LysR family transcriptional regulator [Achromobacter xylosoxidans]CUR70015.1 CysJI operon transcriptional activator [Achromobacter xylosoxidans]